MTQKGRQKRSVSLHGHRTSISLEPEFWAVIDDNLGEASLAGFLRRMDDRRLVQDSPLGLAAYLRVWALATVGNQTVG